MMLPSAEAANVSELLSRRASGETLLSRPRRASRASRELSISLGAVEASAFADVAASVAAGDVTVAGATVCASSSL
jgi:hypothetical protein